MIKEYCVYFVFLTSVELKYFISSGIQRPENDSKEIRRWFVFSKQKLGWKTRLNHGTWGRSEEFAVVLWSSKRGNWT